jgi:hypothetical protein
VPPRPQLLGLDRERRVLTEDRGLQLAQLGARLETQLVDERPASVVVGRQRVRLAAGAVERQHQLTPQPFAERLLCHERLKLGDELAVASQREQRLDAVVDRGEPQLLQACDLRIFCAVALHPPPPQSERLLEPLGRSPWVAGGEQRAPSGDEPLEAQRIEFVLFDRDPVAALLPGDPPRTARDRLAQVGHVHLQRLPGPLRGPLAPHRVDETVDRHDRVRRQQQAAQKRALLRAAERPTALHLERAQDPKERPHRQVRLPESLPADRPPSGL